MLFLPLFWPCALRRTRRFLHKRTVIRLTIHEHLWTVAVPRLAARQLSYAAERSRVYSVPVLRESTKTTLTGKLTARNFSVGL